MNYSQARQKVNKAIEEKAVELNLSSIGDKEKLTDNDLEELLPHILKLVKSLQREKMFHRIGNLFD